LDIRKLCEVLRINGSIRSDRNYAVDKDRIENIDKSHCETCYQPQVCLCPKFNESISNFPSPTGKYLQSLTRMGVTVSSQMVGPDSLKNDQVFNGVLFDLMEDYKRKPKVDKYFTEHYSANFYDLLYKILEPIASLRIKAEDALKHPFLIGARINR